MYFTDTPNIKELISRNVLLDLSPVWDAAPVKDGAAGATIEENIPESDIYKQVFGNGDGSVYGLPYTQGIGGIIYDHDFFEQEGFLLTDKDTANGLTKGRDGIEGTYDDGLPITFADFKTLCDRLKQSYYAFLYSDQVSMDVATINAINYLYDGEENFKVLSTYDGTYTTASGETIQITPETGYLAWYERVSQGKKYAVDFVADFLLNSEYYYTQSVGNHTDSEQKYLFSAGSGQRRAAMTINGTWWENEARPAFTTSETRLGPEYGYGKRDFRMMPAPIPDMEVAERRGTADKSVFVANNDGAVFALKSGNDEKDRAIIDFLTDYASGYGSEIFSAATGCMLAYDYELSPETISAMTPFGQNVYEILRSDHTVILHMDLMSYLEPINYLTSGASAPGKWKTKNGTKSYDTLLPAIRDSNKDTVWNSLINSYTPASWAEVYNTYGRG